MTAASPSRTAGSATPGPTLPRQDPPERPARGTLRDLVARVAAGTQTAHSAGVPF